MTEVSMTLFSKCSSQEQDFHTGRNLPYNMRLLYKNVCINMCSSGSEMSVFIAFIHFNSRFAGVVGLSCKSNSGVIKIRFKQVPLPTNIA